MLAHRFRPGEKLVRCFTAHGKPHQERADLLWCRFTGQQRVESRFEHWNGKFLRAG